MHNQYVAPQARWADMVLAHPIAEADVYRVAVRLEALLAQATPQRSGSTFPAHMWRPEERRALPWSAPVLVEGRRIGTV